MKMINNVNEAALTWAQRAQAELGAGARFKLLVEELSDLGAHPQVVSMARQAQADEQRHAVLCRDVALSLGHQSGFALFEGIKMEFEKPWLKGLGPKDILLCEMTLMCCITETINASLLNSIYANSKQSKTQKIIQEILRDEVKHSQMGWAHLAHESQKRDCSFLAEYLCSMLEISVKDELFVPFVGSKMDENSFTLGVLPVALRLEQFIQTMEAIVIPGLNQFNIDTSNVKSWLKNKVEIFEKGKWLTPYSGNFF